MPNYLKRYSTRRQLYSFLSRFKVFACFAISAEKQNRIRPSSAVRRQYIIYPIFILECHTFSDSSVPLFDFDRN